MHIYIYSHAPNFTWDFLKILCIFGETFEVVYCSHGRANHAKDLVRSVYGHPTSASGNSSEDSYDIVACE